MSSKGLIRRGDTWYFRARVPTAFIDAYGREMVSVSLQTTDRAEAKARLKQHRDQLDQELAELGRQVRQASPGYVGTLLHLTDDDIDRICQRFRTEVLAQDELERIRGISAEDTALYIDILQSGVADLRAAYARGDLTDVHGELTKFLARAGLRVPAGTAPFERLARRFQQAQIEVYDAMLRRRRGEVVDIPMQPLDDLTFDDVYKVWKKRVDNRPIKTLRAFEQAFGELKKRCRVMTPRMLRKADAIALRDAMIASGEMSRPTVVKLLGFLRAAFQCIVNDGVIEVNPFAGIEVRLDKKEQAQKSRLPFLPEHLQTIFSGPIYQQAFVPRPSLGNACYWLPLLALFTGARLEELGQLHAEDVCMHPEHGQYMRIHDEGKRHVKTDSSIRNVPVHSELVKLGFLELVEVTKSGRLFPALRYDSSEILTSSFSYWFGQYLDQLEIISPQLVFNSFRHTFSENCKQKATLIPSEVREAIVGHLSPKLIKNMYGNPQYPLGPMAEAMKHVDYAGLDLSAAYAARPRQPTAGSS
jgi:integrase